MMLNMHWKFCLTRKSLAQNLPPSLSLGASPVYSSPHRWLAVAPYTRPPPCSQSLRTPLCLCDKFLLALLFLGVPISGLSSVRACVCVCVCGLQRVCVCVCGIMRKVSCPFMSHLERWEQCRLNCYTSWLNDSSNGLQQPADCLCWRQTAGQTGSQ